MSTDSVLNSTDVSVTSAYGKEGDWEVGRGKTNKQTKNVQGHTQCVVKYIPNLVDLFELKPSGTAES